MAEQHTAARPKRRTRKAAAQPAAAGKVKVTQTGSPIGRQGYQRATLKGLGLNKMNRARVLDDTPATRGRIANVRHLVRVEPA